MSGGGGGGGTLFTPTPSLALQSVNEKQQPLYTTTVGTFAIFCVVVSCSFLPLSTSLCAPVGTRVHYIFIDQEILTQTDIHCNTRVIALFADVCSVQRSYSEADVQRKQCWMVNNQLVSYSTG